MDEDQDDDEDGDKGDELLHSTLPRAHLKQLSAALLGPGTAACIQAAPAEQLQAVLLKLAALVAKYTGTCLHQGDTVSPPLRTGDLLWALQLPQLCTASRPVAACWAPGCHAALADGPPHPENQADQAQSQDMCIHCCSGCAGGHRTV